VQAQLRLQHDSNGDACEALVGSQLAIDLTKLAGAYREGYQATEGTIIVRLGGTSTPYDF
jgi:hypothetical protein